MMEKAEEEKTAAGTGHARAAPMRAAASPESVAWHGKEGAKTAAGIGCKVCHKRPAAQNAAGARQAYTASRPWRSMNAITCSSPCPDFTLPITNGRAPRILRASLSITSRLAPT